MQCVRNQQKVLDVSSVTGGGSSQPWGTVPWGRWENDIRGGGHWAPQGAFQCCLSQGAQVPGPCHPPLACQDLQVGCLDGAWSLPSRRQETSGGGRLGELAGLGWQDPKAPGEGIWDRVGVVEETGCFMTKSAGLADVSHVSWNPGAGRRLSPGTSQVGGWGSPHLPSAGCVPGPVLPLRGLLELCLGRLEQGGWHPFVTREPEAGTPH